MSILFAIIFLVVIFKCVGLVLGVCGKLLGAVLSLFGFILSIAVGAIVFGISTAFALVLLCIAAGWLLIKLIFKDRVFRMDTESVRLRDGDAGLQNPSRSLDKHGKIH